MADEVKTEEAKVEATHRKEEVKKPKAAKAEKPKKSAPSMRL